MNEFPKMVYKGGKLSDKPENYRIVEDADGLAAAKADGFSPFDPDKESERKSAARAPKKAAKAEGSKDA